MFSLVPVLVESLFEPHLTLDLIKPIFVLLNPVVVGLADFLRGRAHVRSHVFRTHSLRQPLANAEVPETVRRHLHPRILEHPVAPFTPFTVRAGKRRAAQRLKLLGKLLRDADTVAFIVLTIENN